MYKHPRKKIKIRDLLRFTLNKSRSSLMITRETKTS